MAAVRNIVLHLDDPDALTAFLPAVAQLARDLKARPQPKPGADLRRGHPYPWLMAH